MAKTRSHCNASQRPINTSMKDFFESIARQIFGCEPRFAPQNKQDQR